VFGLRCDTDANSRQLRGKRYVLYLSVCVDVIQTLILENCGVSVMFCVGAYHGQDHTRTTRIQSFRHFHILLRTHLHITHTKTNTHTNTYKHSHTNTNTHTLSWATRRGGRSASVWSGWRWCSLRYTRGACRVPLPPLPVCECVCV
jgi:hypothetical protein